jgi:hypothetical protein
VSLRDDDDENRQILEAENRLIKEFMTKYEAHFIQQRDRIRELEAALLTSSAEGAREMRERAATIADAINSGRGNEAEIARAIRALPDTPGGTDMSYEFAYQSGYDSGRAVAEKKAADLSELILQTLIVQAFENDEEMEKLLMSYKELVAELIRQSLPANQQA